MKRKPYTKKTAYVMQVEATNTGELNQYEFTGLTQCLKTIPLQFKIYGNKITIIKTKKNEKI